MPRRFQYPIHGKLDLPEALRPETTVVDKWHQPLSEPVRRSAGALAAAAILASGAVFVAEPSDMPYDPAIEGSPWTVPLNEPVRTVPFNPAALMPVVFDNEVIWPSQVTPAAPTVGQAVMPGGVQRTQYQAVAEPVLVPAIAPEYDWFAPLSEPVQVTPPLPVGAMPSFETDAASLLLSENITVDKWLVPLSEPIFLPSPHAALDASGEVHANEELPSPVAAPDYGWYQPLSEPVLVAPPLPLGALYPFVTDSASLLLPEATKLSKWYQPFSEPIFLPSHHASLAAGEFHANEELPAPPAAAPDYDWFKPLTEPTLPLPPRQTAGEVGASPFIGPEVVFLDRWFEPFSEPVLPPRPIAYLSSGATDANETLPAPVEPTTLDRWFQPLSKPVLVPPPLPTADNPWVAEAPYYFGPEIVFSDKWLQPLSEPVRPRPTFAHLMPTVQDANETLPPPVIAPDYDWYHPLTEPTLPRPTFAYLKASGAFDANETLPPTVSVGVYRRVTLADFDARVVERLGNSVFWDSSERLKLINEALRTWNSLTAQWKRRVEIKTVVSGGKPHIYYDLPGNMTMSMRVEHNNRPLSQGSIFDWDQGDPYWEGERGTPEEWAPVGINLIALRPVDPSPGHTLTIDGIAQTPTLVSATDLIDIGEEEFNTILDYIQHIAAFKEGGQEFQSTLRLYQKFIRAAMVKNERLRGSDVFRRIIGEYTDEHRKPRRTKSEGESPIGMR